MLVISPLRCGASAAHNPFRHTLAAQLEDAGERCGHLGRDNAALQAELEAQRGATSAAEQRTDHLEVKLREADQKRREAGREGEAEVEKLKESMEALGE